LDKKSPTFGGFFMTKYDEGFKLKVVREHLSEGMGAKRLAHRHGVSAGQLKRWIAAYREHGQSGLRRRGASYDAQFKRSVLRRMWAEQWSLEQTETAFDIRCPAHIGKWERQYHMGGIQALNPRPRGRPKQMTTSDLPKAAPERPDEARSREELLEQVKYLRAEVAYLKKLQALAQAKELTAQKKRG
jgi:transposase